MTIERRLVQFDRAGECKVVDPDSLESNVDPVAILGDPGMGKTTLLRGLCEQADMTYVNAAALVLAEDPASLIPEDALPVVDGIDEAASPCTGSTVAAVLGQLRETESLPPILACRAAEWRDSADLARIKDAYAREPTVLYLAPFDEDEACTFLAEEYPGVQVHALLGHPRNRERKLSGPGGRNSRGRQRSDAVPKEAMPVRPFSPPCRRGHPPGSERIPKAYPAKRRDGCALLRCVTIETAFDLIAERIGNHLIYCKITHY